MEDVDLHYAKEHLEELISRARRGEDVRINDANGAAVKLTPLEGARETSGTRRLGHLQGKIPPPTDDVFAPMNEEELMDWYGDDA